MTDTHQQGLKELYLAALILDEDDALNDIDASRWAQAEELRKALEIPLHPMLLDLHRGQSPVWLNHPRLLIQVLGLEDEDGVLRDFACECAARVLPLFQAARRWDRRLEEALEIAWLIDTEELDESELLEATINAEESIQEAISTAAFLTRPDHADRWRAAIAAGWSVQATLQDRASEAARSAAYEAARARAIAESPAAGQQERLLQQRRLLLLAFDEDD
ncbi:MAG: hypothetical protein AAFV53_26955 [Myxococcota bacterium]